MDKSRTPGKNFSKHSLDLKSAQRLLDQCVQNSIFQTVLAALGADADLHIVGGTVRETLLKEVKATDLDLATILPPEEALSRATAAGLRVIETGLQHGTIMLLVDKQHIEITTFRATGKHDVAEYSTDIETDLSGRDFTINAIAFSVRTGQLVDPFSGLHDLDSGVVKAVGSAAERFAEDPLRILRMIRFGSASGRLIEESTLAAATEAVALLQQVSPERIRDEFLKILLSDCAAEGLRTLHRIGALDLILPELSSCAGVEQNDFHVEDVFEHTLTVLERAPLKQRLRLAALFHDLGKPGTVSVDDDGRRHFYRHELLSEKICLEALKRLRIAKQESKNIATLVKYHMRPFQCGPSAVRRLLRDLDELFDDWIALKTADAPPTQPKEEFEKDLEQFMQLVKFERERQEQMGRKLAINGNDLIALGVPAGPELGEMLSALEEMTIETPELNTREALLDEASRLIKCGE